MIQQQISKQETTEESNVGKKELESTICGKSSDSTVIQGSKLTDEEREGELRSIQSSLKGMHEEVDRNLRRLLKREESILNELEELRGEIDLETEITEESNSLSSSDRRKHHPRSAPIRSFQSQ
eukprot:TRINITY_DN4748_c0_g1_i3.p1 TRINITY_DN4748_c0_g1~~TRINITY_DN4748_c0_g1_i3.p1  ORF type:complete len:124 (-),score=43.62 TRINITY_DN4748_c0_g1_i3:24-395(-)